MNSLYLLAKPMGVFSVRFFSWSFWVCLLILGDAHYTSPAEDFEWLCSLRFPATVFVYILKLESAGSSSIINKARGCFHNVFFTLKIYWFIIIVIRTDFVFIFLLRRAVILLVLLSFVIFQGFTETLLLMGARFCFGQEAVQGKYRFSGFE